MSQPTVVDTTDNNSTITNKMKAIESRINSKTFDLSFDEVRSYEFFLTTSDNPFNPFENFRSWYAFDERKHYCSSGLLARIAKVPTELGEFQEKFAIVQAMHDIVRLNASGMHKIVIRPIENGTLEEGSEDSDA